VRGAAVMAPALAASLLAATPANAGEVWAHGGTVIIKVVTGDKNYRQRTQWVTSITVMTSTRKENSYGCGRFEGWTQGFYRAADRCESVHFYISRWVSSGNHVCGAFQDIDRRWSRSIACITIKV
ncbi:MAG TPA: hypothetical protein VNA12_01330, partial [Mycobacteriales bacterium]|nr:hypothetical protein [Mycobacteriales bacterium]